MLNFEFTRKWRFHLTTSCASGRLMEKKAAAVDLIKARLSERPSDPRLWYVEVYLSLSLTFLSLCKAELSRVSFHEYKVLKNMVIFFLHYAVNLVHCLYIYIQ